MKSDDRWILVLGIILSLFMTSVTALADDLSINGYTLVTSKRVSLYEYDYTYKASLSNTGRAVTDVKAQVVSSSPYIKTVENELDFGDVASGATVESIDTAVFRHDRRGPFDTTKLTWTINATPVLVVVPDVTGRTEETAQAMLQTSGLAVGNETTSYTDNIAAGLVVSQNPAAGSSVAPGATVELVVSLGPELVSVPDVAGMNQADATAVLLSANCILGSVGTAASDTVAAGQVVSQDPPAGTSIASGSAVSVILSSGPEVERGRAGDPFFTPLEEDKIVEDSTGKKFPVNELLVALKDDYGYDDIKNIVEAFGGKIVGSNGVEKGGIYKVRFPINEIFELEFISNELSNQVETDITVFNYISENLNFNTDLSRAEPQSLISAYDGNNIQGAWSIIANSHAPLTPINIHVSDTPIDTQHSEFNSVNNIET